MLTAYTFPEIFALITRWTSVRIFCNLFSVSVRVYLLHIAAVIFNAYDLLIWLAKIAASVSLGIALLLPLMGFAEEVSAASAVSANSPPVDTPSAMDPTRNYMSGKLESWARSIDSFFGDYRNYQESNDSVIQLYTSQVIGYLGEPKYDLALNAKLSLPNTERDLKLLIETDPEEKTTLNSTIIQPRPFTQVSTPRSIAAALRYEKAEAERWHFSTDGGVKLAGLASTPFVRARLRLAMPLEQWRLKVAESLFWFSSIGTGESTLIDFERQLNEQQLFRASSNATWLNNTQNFDLSQSFSIFHALNERSMLLYQISAIGVSRPQTQVTDYVILMTYRYRLHREWVFLEISPQVHFPQVVNYQTSTLLSMRLEFLLDKSR
ncbi:MAG TPA: hypothetical protein VMV48_11745 [Gallionellaceae bacterium]|nr:hypothetical protein [Gallionellaceae bacterium]